MHIGLNLLYLIPGRIGGGETYARELLKGLSTLDNPRRFTVFLNPEAWDTFTWIDDLPSWQRIRCDISNSAWRRHIWEQTQLPRLCRKLEIDLLHSLAYVLPLNAHCKQVVTIHDALFCLDHNFLPPLKRKFWGFMVPRSAQTASVIITDCHYSARDLQLRLKIAPEKIRVAPLGPGQTLPPPTPWETLSNRYGLTQPFFFAVGTYGHKRLDIISAAVALVRRSHPGASLVVAGPVHTEDAIDKDTRALGFVPAADLAGLYANTAALVSAAAIEGFGLPALEAMQLGAPVVACDRGSMPEVVGDAGIVVPYGDPDRLAAALQQLCEDRELRQELTARGIRRAAEFSWHHCAVETMAAYESVFDPRS